MAIDLTRLPPTLPVTVRRTTPDGLPTKPQIDWEQYTRDWFGRSVADMDQRLVEVIDVAGENSARITTEIIARATADSALASRIDTVQANVNTVSARVTTETTARVNADIVLAQQTTNLTTVVNQNTAQLQIQAQSINGLEVRYSVVGSINGQTGGFIFSGIQRNDGGVFFNTEFYSNVIIHGNVMINGTLTTPKAQANAWTDAGVVYATGAGIADAVFLRAGAKVLIRAIAYAASGYINILTLAPPNSIRIFVNGTLFASQAAGVSQYEHWTGTLNETYWRLVPTPLEYVYVVPFDGVFTLAANLDTGLGASWVLAHGEQAR